MPSLGSHGLDDFCDLSDSWSDQKVKVEHERNELMKS